MLTLAELISEVNDPEVIHAHIVYGDGAREDKIIHKRGSYDPLGKMSPIEYSRVRVETLVYWGIAAGRAIEACVLHYGAFPGAFLLYTCNDYGEWGWHAKAVPEPSL